VLLAAVELEGARAQHYEQHGIDRQCYAVVLFWDVLAFFQKD